MAKETELSTYRGYSKALTELEKNNREIAVVESQKTVHEGDNSANDRIVVSLGEQNLVLTAAGLALSGRRVFVNAPYSPLYISRSYEQIRATVAVPNLKVTLSSLQGSDSHDRAGAARQMYEDIALMRLMPNMSVLVPCDMTAAYRLTYAAALHNGPSYLRLSDNDGLSVYEDGDCDFHIGGARLLREGDGVTICACGIMVKEALVAEKILSQQGISVEIIDCYSVKPFPEQMLVASVRRTGCCVVAEKHTGIAGLYGAVTECLCKNYTVPVKSVSIADDFGQSGTPEELQEYHGLTSREIVHNVIQVLAMRRR